MTILPALLAAAATYLFVSGLARGREPSARRRVRRPKASSRASLETRLRQAGVSLSPARYRATVLGSAVATWLVVDAVTGSVPLSVLPAVAVGFGPRAFYRRRRERLLAERVAAWPEAIRDVLTHLSVEQTLHRALSELGRSGPAPLRPVWRSYEANAAVLDVPAALAQVRADLADPVSDHVLEALEAAHDRGTTVVVAVLRSLADHVTRDAQLREQIITSQAETRSQAVVAMVLPFVVLAFLVSSSEEFAGFYSTSGGWIVIGLGAAMAFGGWKLISTLGRIPSEPRVLTRRGETA
jgi:tight adherence protein B